MFTIISVSRYITEKHFWIKNPWHTAFIISAIFFLLRLLFIAFGPLDLAPDEAQYWDWSRNLDWSYTTKPPLTTWLLALSTAIFGNTFIGVRFFALLGQIAVPLLAMGIARQVSPFHLKTETGWWAFWLTSAAPIITAGGLIMSPDVPSLTLWLATIWMLTKIDFAASPRWQPWCLIGLFIGLAGLAKPTAALFFPLLGLFLLWQAPRWLLKPQIYVSGLIALACQAPVFYWNATHHWAMFRHVLDQTDSDTRWGGWQSLLDFLAGQAGAIGPITLLTLLPVLFWLPKQQHKRLLWVFSAVPLAFFTITSLNGKIQPNWPILGSAVALILLAISIPKLPRWSHLLLIAGLIFNITIIGLLHDTFILRNAGISLKIKTDPTKPMLGWRGLGEQLGNILEKYPNAHIVTTRYQTTAGLAFHTPQQPHVLYTNPGWRRENHYDFQQWPNLTGQKILYVNEGGTLLPHIAEKFNNCQHLQDLKATRNGLTLRTATVYLCEGK
ncbi:MAG: glycosyltransferase family 39 protein [Alphaproteobacteria bacterium]|nr:glycosyltransferase family 39 protein [Alphaproteobacteria bacterium]MDD9919916.1 glycosyltransferase family 39 protein [Alphaproteobacteria bacterium]